MIGVVKMLTLGSLFDGIGGFPLAAQKENIKTLWTSEIDPWCRRVTDTRFKNVDHYGNIKKLKGDELEPVDILTFGFPCQDLSIAGKKKGLEGTRSGLFNEVIRLIKEMKKPPRFLICENVKHLLKINNGEDFRYVLSKLLQCSIPRFDAWKQRGAILSVKCSLAWRVFNSSEFAPQNRERVYVIIDTQGGSAPEILFDPNTEKKFVEEVRKKWYKRTQISKWNLWYVKKNSARRKLILPTITTTTINQGNRRYVFIEKNKKLRWLTKEEILQAQGFPEWWLANLHTQEPTAGQVDYYKKMFENKKCTNWIKKWLSEPISDYQKQKMIGNSITVDIAQLIFRSLKNVIRPTI